MDFNSIEERLERLYSAIDERADVDLQKHVRVKLVGTPGKEPFEAKISFDGVEDRAGKSRVIISINENLANLKDNLKNRLGARRELVEEFIDTNVALQLLIDLANANKHGYPLTRTERSGRSPRLENIGCSCVVPPGETFGINLKSGQVIGSEKCRIEITADVVDKAGEPICKWSSLINDAIEGWETFMRQHNISS
ncbi:MAG: hypothetical protein IH944_05375 [Armatimonadetes bacterium]|nr:hypothetical protein [Armatimonadota bacterium]